MALVSSFTSQIRSRGLQDDDDDWRCIQEDPVAVLRTSWFFFPTTLASSAFQSLTSLGDKEFRRQRAGWFLQRETAASSSRVIP